MKSVAILGGGLAGLSAGVYLADAGFQVKVYESRPILGGRAYSVSDSKTGHVMDNGQHLMMGCYKHTLDFLKKIGTDHLLELQETMKVPLLQRGGKIHELKASSLPAPLHLASALLCYSAISWKEKLKLAGFLRKVQKVDITPTQQRRVSHPAGIHWESTGSKTKSGMTSLEDLDQLSCTQWLQQNEISENTVKSFLEPLILATLNEVPEKVSAKLLAIVFREALLKGKSESKMLFAKVGLSDLYTEAAQKFIEDRDGKVFTKQGVKHIYPLSPCGRGQGEGISKIQKIILDNGQEISADYYLSTLPANALWKTLPEKLQQLPYFSTLNQIEYSPIYNLNLWFEKKWFKPVFAGLIDSPIHWIFDKSKILFPPLEKGGNCYLSLTISAAHTLKELASEDLVQLALKELNDFFPESRGIALTHFRILKELQATPSFRPGTNALRPTCETPLSNFFLAGDWTQTELPATIEGAVKSGKLAAETILTHKNS